MAKAQETDSTAKPAEELTTDTFEELLKTEFRKRICKKH